MIEDAIFTYAADGAYAVTVMTREARQPKGITPIKVPMPFAIITSQTCDLRQPSRVRKRPFINAARVVDATTEFTKADLGNIRAGRIGDIRPLTGSRFTGNKNEVWVADLRFEVALERSVLVDRNPIEGFADEAGYLAFSEDVGAMRSRPAIDDKVLVLLLRPLKMWFESGIVDPDEIVEVRVRCHPTTIEAESVELFLLTRDNVDPETIQDRVNEWRESIRDALPSELVLIDINVETVSQFTRADGLGSERVDFDDLST